MTIPTRTKISALIRACAIAVLSFLTANAFADDADILRATQNGERAQVIVRMKAQSNARRWEDARSIAEQKQMVTESLRDVRPALRRLGVTTETTFATLPFVGVRVNREQALALLDSPDVDGVYINRKEHKVQSAYEKQTLASSVPSMDVADAWAKGYDGQDTIIAVIDGGFRTSHPMLSSKVIGEACFSAHDPSFDTYTQCPSGQTPQTGTGSASNCPSGSSRCDHGTHVASTAAGNDGTNFGVARAAKLLLIDVFSEVRSTSDCSPDPSPCELTDSLSVLKALDYVNQLASQTTKLAAVNLSLGGSSSEGYCDSDPRAEVIAMLRAKGVATTAATGNEGKSTAINKPSCVAAAVAVGAVNDGVAVASFSNISSITDLMAPGVSIRAASGQSNGFVTLSGTSMAAPHAAGAFAILRGAFPSKTTDEIEQAFKATGLKTFRTDVSLNIPKIQVNKAILRLQGRDRREFNNVLTSSRATTLGQAFLRFQNNGTSVGNVTVSLRDSTTGQTLGTWTSPNILPHASMQFDIGNLEAEAKAALQNTAIIDSARPFYNLTVESTIPGYMQHIVWARGAGVLTNLTSCSEGLSDDTRSLMNVHSSAVEGYPSRIRIANTGSADQSAVLTFFGASNGRQLGSYTTSIIPVGGSLEVTLARIEAAVPALLDPAVTGLNTIYQYNVRLDGLTGYMQHIVENQRSGVLLDMSPKCDMGVSQ